jgi:hypothetical protein
MDLSENKGIDGLFAVTGRQSFPGAALSLELLDGGIYAAFANTEHNHQRADVSTANVALVL